MVILVPLCAVLLVVSSVWPAARRRLAAPNALLALSLLPLIPLTTSAGEWLEGRVDEDPLVEHHAELGDTALLFTLPVVILAVLVWWRSREQAAAAGELPLAAGTGALSRVLSHERPLLAPTSRAVAAGIAAVCVFAAGAATWDIYRIGDSGAKAAWHDGFNADSGTE